MDCLIQITQLMKENFGISRLGSHKLSSNTKCFDDLPNAVYFAENSLMVNNKISQAIDHDYRPITVDRSTGRNIIIIILLTSDYSYY